MSGESGQRTSRWRPGEGPRTLRERLGWWLLGASPRRVRDHLDEATQEIADTGRGDRPHAKDRAMLAVGAAAEELGLYSPENAFKDNARE